MPHNANIAVILPDLDFYLHFSLGLPYSRGKKNSSTFGYAIFWADPQRPIAAKLGATPFVGHVRNLTSKILRVRCNSVISIFAGVFWQKSLSDADTSFCIHRFPPLFILRRKFSLVSKLAFSAPVAESSSTTFCGYQLFQVLRCFDVTNLFYPSCISLLLLLHLSGLFFFFFFLLHPFMSHPFSCFVGLLKLTF